MLTVVIIMFSGILAGYLIRSFGHLVRASERLTTWAIYALLLLMGIGVGANREIMTSLHTLGLKALWVAIGGVVGSVLTGWLTFRVFFKKTEQ